MLPKPQWWTTLLSFISVSLACISLIFGHTKLTQSFSGSHGDLGSPLLPLLNPIFHWSCVSSHREADQDTDLAQKWVGEKKLFSVLVQMTIQTTALEKWKKYQKSSIRARDCFQAASIICLSFLLSIFLDSTLKSLSRLHHLAWIRVVFSSSPTLLILSCLRRKSSPLGWSPSPYSLFKQPAYFGGGSRRQLWKNQGLFASLMAQTDVCLQGPSFPETEDPTTFSSLAMMAWWLSLPSVWLFWSALLLSFGGQFTVHEQVWQQNWGSKQWLGGKRGMGNP